MTGLVTDAALLVTLAALVSAAAVLTATGRVLVAMPVLLDMLLAAGLLRLALHPTLTQLAGTALLVVVKRLASVGVRTAGAARLAPTARRAPVRAAGR